jgi:endonuclease/exonuclease/phosphatase family metal-dependent hydrolase
MCAASPFLGPVDAPAVHVMTLNVRRRMPRAWPSARADRWSCRRPLLARLLLDERPGVLGLQEVLPDQSAEIRDLLGSGYESAGSGRDARGGGERCELHVDSSRFRIVSTTTRWLSDSPERAGSRSFGNLIPRIVVLSEVEDIAAALRIHVLVTHLDHLSARSRVRSAQMLAGAVRRLGGPVVVLGDFNTDVGSAAHDALLARGDLVDALDVAATRVAPSVRGSYSRYGPPRTTGRRLDWILVDPAAAVERAGVNAARFDGRAASDHDPVQAVVRWGGAAS